MNNQKKKRKKKGTYCLVDFAVLADHEIKIKESEKKILAPYQGTKKFEIIQIPSLLRPARILRRILETKKRLGITQTSMKNHHLTLVRINLQGV